MPPQENTEDDVEVGIADDDITTNKKYNYSNTATSSFSTSEKSNDLVWSNVNMKLLEKKGNVKMNILQVSGNYCTLYGRLNDCWLTIYDRNFLSNDVECMGQGRSRQDHGDHGCLRCRE